MKKIIYEVNIKIGKDAGTCTIDFYKQEMPFVKKSTIKQGKGYIEYFSNYDNKEACFTDICEFFNISETKELN